MKEEEGWRAQHAAGRDPIHGTSSRSALVFCLRLHDFSDSNGFSWLRPIFGVPGGAIESILDRTRPGRPAGSRVTSPGRMAIAVPARHIAAAAATQAAAHGSRAAVLP
ncbi:unnamed protein product, partial [Prorocentrum cordatum]